MDVRSRRRAEGTEALAPAGSRPPAFGGDPRSANEVGPAQLTPRRLMAGATSATLAQIIAMASSFCLIPYVVHHIGEEAYGLWAVTGAVTAYFMLLDCGVGAGFVKYLAEFLERGEYNEARQVMTFGLLFYLALGILAFPVVYFLAPHVVAYLKVRPDNDTTATNLLLLSIGYFFANACLAVFSALIVAMQRSDISGLISSVGQVVYVASVMVFVHRNYGVYAL